MMTIHTSTKKHPNCKLTFEHLQVTYIIKEPKIGAFRPTKATKIGAAGSKIEAKDSIPYKVFIIN